MTGKDGGMQVTAAARLVRSIIVTSCMMSLALGAHLVGGSSLPPWPLLVGLTMFALMPIAFLAGRRLSLPVLSGLLVSGQVLLHHVFEMLSSPAACAPQGVHGAGTDHAAVMMQCPPVGSTSEHLVPHLVDSGAAPIMVIGHLLAVLVMVWILSRGENAFWSLLAWLRPLIGLPSPEPVTGRPQLPEYAERPITPPARRNVPADVRRGPPEIMPRKMALG
ncbi:hypothetical protein [Arthrobacter sp. B1805]|uniref:hypothetical protein n=1 Tax=Arthrobacter sp. B1805 TaxID=2058892 RepID=UPI0015E31CB5|nr:hypothetical protein [Arthrobacter sp. B1805]